MRLLITTDTIGGVWTFTQELSRGLLERGCRVLLVSFGRMPSAAQQQQCDGLAKKFGARFEYVPSEIALEWMDANGRVWEKGAQLLEREAARFAPDLIHSNQFCFGALDVSVPRVVTAHSDVLSWARACRGIPLEPSEWLECYVALVQAGLLRADAVVAPTRWMLNALAEEFAIPRNAVVVPNGRQVDADFNGPRTLRAVTAGRLWDEAKGMDVLADVRSPMPITVAGETQQGSAVATRLPEFVQFAGQLSNAEMLALLEESAVYLCLSKYEPFGLAALEAAQSGCAVVARDIPSLREVWSEGALYFKDAQSLSAVLQRLHGNPDLLKEARERSFLRARNYSVDRMVDGYMAVFRQALMELPRAEYVA